MAVACLVATARVSGPRLEVAGRRQPLTVPPGTERIPVVRVEVAPATTPAELAAHRDALVEVIRSATRGASGIQIDFDARRSERGAYADLLRAVRAALPRGTRLSITALASWCLGDRWLEGLPVDEAVPMLFRLGSDGPEVRARLAAGEDFTADVCRGAYGLSTDERPPKMRRGRRVYMFHDRRWSEDAYARARERRAEGER